MVIFHSYVSLPEGMFYDFGWCWIIFFEILVATHPIRNGPQCRATMIQAGLWAVGQNHRLSNYASISARNEEITSQPVHLEFAAFTSPKMGTTKPQFSQWSMGIQYSCRSLEMTLRKNILCIPCCLHGGRNGSDFHLYFGNSNTWIYIYNIIVHYITTLCMYIL
jgi:hypothetical protein